MVARKRKKTSKAARAAQPEDRGAALKQWCEEHWNPALRRWLEMLPCVPVRVAEGSLEVTEENLKPCSRELYLMAKRPEGEEWKGVLESGPDGGVVVRQRRDSKQAEAATALAQACRAGSTVSIPQVRGFDLARASWDGTRPDLEPLAISLEEQPDPALLEQRDIANSIDERIEKVLLHLFSEQKQVEDEALADHQRIENMRLQARMNAEELLRIRQDPTASEGPPAITWMELTDPQRGMVRRALKEPKGDTLTQSALLDGSEGAHDKGEHRQQLRSLIGSRVFAQPDGPRSGYRLTNPPEGLPDGVLRHDSWREHQ